MNYKLIKTLGLGTLGLTLALSSCTDKVGDNEFDNINNGSTSQKAATVQTAVGLLKGAMPLIHDAREHKYQYQFNLHIDNYSGYLVVANSLQGRLPRTYSPNAGFQTGPQANLLWVAQQVVPVINSAEELKVPEMGAIAAILYDFMAAEYVDVHGPMPYKDYRALKSEPPITYEKVSEIYAQILASLKKQQQILKDLSPLSEEAKARLQEYDLIAGKDVQNWIKFANSLRMRLAMRMVKAAPEQAKAEFESAVADGALEATDKDIALLTQGRHPLYTISENWDDTRLNANFANLLTRLKHPALKEWFTPIPQGFKDKEGNVTVEGDGVFAGMRAGMATYEKEKPIFSDSYKKFSRINPSYVTKNVAIFKASEVQFLLAEGALRDWSVGGRSAKAYYETGIRTSFTNEGLSGLVEYVTRKASACPQIDYIDYWDSRYNSPAKENGSEVLGVAWDNSADKEKQLEMIITQKYIANYPLSLESWSEFRRTGYPRMIVNDAGDTGDGSIPPHSWKASEGKIQPDLFIHRIPFVRTGSVALDDIINTAMPALKVEDKSIFSGQDYQAAHLWWDVPGKGNF
ncbi:SusD/RagB family nutrient-binding outer membrane lipoprotein [Porphyromonas sp. COT-290 OH3588]|uniref:SusD/RagB family nutrient-binding outer membrane lipoprotein n=1 Tax=Porphyromonas sp. COT-290 OH3588 TaxID=1515617 RepID=UPI00052DD1B5|nr:SusD/RagB family nutrient-binding outer membrane lipoprotein [Porphyromonas sp. COT-290 OH3588]KGN97119.1 hypothetical protein HQ48_09285 [Porphyromonas sp. COT-290 OH3588]